MVGADGKVLSNPPIEISSGPKALNSTAGHMARLKPRPFKARADHLANADSTAINKTIELLLAGKVVAIKGVGGFHLSVDAMHEAAVMRLRTESAGMGSRWR